MIADKKAYNFFIDIDDTLLPRGKSEISQKVMDALHYARSFGCKIFLNTARPFSNIQDYLKYLPVLDGICCGAGTYIEANGKCIYSRFIDEKDLDQMLFHCFEHLNGSTVIFEGYDALYILGNDTKNAFPTKLITSQNDFKTVYKDAKIQKFATCGSVYPSASLINGMRKWFDVYEYDRYVEGVPFGYGKGYAIHLTEKALGLDPSLSVAMGDSLNDVSMLEYAPTAVVMDNAPQEIKKYATILTDSSLNDGVAAAVYALLN